MKNAATPNRQESAETAIQVLQEQLDQFPIDTQQIFWMNYIDKRSLKEIRKAKDLSISEINEHIQMVKRSLNLAQT